MKPGPMACPDCSASESLQVIDVILGSVERDATDPIVLRPDGTVEYEATGWTEIEWDSAETWGVECTRCCKTVYRLPRSGSDLSSPTPVEDILSSVELALVAEGMQREQRNRIMDVVRGYAINHHGNER